MVALAWANDAAAADDDDDDDDDDVLGMSLSYLLQNGYAEIYTGYQSDSALSTNYLY